MSVKDLAEVLLGVSRASYYNWLNGAEIQTGRYNRFNKSIKVLALAIKKKELPVPTDMYKGKERRNRTLQILRDIIISLKK